MDRRSAVKEAFDELVNSLNGDQLAELMAFLESKIAEYNVDVLNRKW